MSACFAVLADGYLDRVRDFPAHPDLCGLFRIARVDCLLSPTGGVALTLAAPDRALIAARDGVMVDTAEGPRQAVAPGDLDKDLPAFDLAMPFFTALAASLGQALGTPPARLARHAAPGLKWVYGAEDFTAEPCDAARMRTGFCARSFA